MGSATVFFNKHDQAAKATSALDGVKIDGRPVRVEMLVSASALPAAGRPSSLADRVTYVSPISRQHSFLHHPDNQRRTSRSLLLPRRPHQVKPADVDRRVAVVVEVKAPGRLALRRRPLRNLMPKWQTTSLVARPTTLPPVPM
jgi:RNA recognition motif-containing protein